MVTGSFQPPLIFIMRSLRITIKQHNIGSFCLYVDAYTYIYILIYNFFCSMAQDCVVSLCSASALVFPRQMEKAHKRLILSLQGVYLCLPLVAVALYFSISSLHVGFFQDIMIMWVLLQNICQVQWKKQQKKTVFCACHLPNAANCVYVK